MKLERVFEDLGDFVAAYRGAISREGMLHVADSHWQLGTTLKVDLRLEDGLALVRGLATVVRIQLLPDGQAGWLVALKFLDLDPASRDLLDRLEQRNTGEGVAPFRLSDPTIRPPGLGARPVHRSTPPPRPIPMSFDFAPEAPSAGPGPAPEPEDEYAPEHEPHPALRGEPAFAGATGATPAADETVPLGFGVGEELEPPPPARTPRGSEATLPMESDEPDASWSAPAELPEDVPIADADGDRPSRVRLLLWASALAAVAVIAVTLTWLLVPELFSGRRVAETVPAAASPEPPGPASGAGSGTTAVPPATDPARADVGPAAAAPDAAPSEPPAAAAAPPTEAPTATPTAAPSSPPPPTAAPVQASATLRILAADWNQDSGGTTLVINASRPVDPGRLRFGRLDGDPGPRQILRLLDVDSSALAVQTAVGGRDLKTIRTWLHDELRPAELHIVLDLADPAVVAAPPEVAGPTIAIRLERAGP